MSPPGETFRAADAELMREAMDWLVRLHERSVSEVSVGEWTLWYESNERHKQAFEPTGRSRRIGGGRCRSAAHSPPACAGCRCLPGSPAMAVLRAGRCAACSSPGSMAPMCSAGCSSSASARNSSERPAAPLNRPGAAGASAIPAPPGERQARRPRRRQARWSPASHSASAPACGCAAAPLCPTYG